MNKNKVKSFEDACNLLGRGTELPDVSSFPETLRKSIIALYKLTVIIEALNGDWKLDWTDWNQYKWFPWFDVKSDNSGLACAISSTGASATDTIIGSRLCLSSREDAIYMGETFPELYTDWLL